MVVSGTLIVSNRKKNELLDDLKRLGFKTFSAGTSLKSMDEIDTDNSSQKSGGSDEEDPLDNLAKGYDYLLSMKLWSLTLERVRALTAERDEKQMELEDIKNKRPSDLWLKDLDALELALSEFENQFVESQAQEDAARLKAQKSAKNRKEGKGKGHVAKGKGNTKAKRVLNESDSEGELDDDSDEEFMMGKKKPSTAKPRVAAPKLPKETSTQPKEDKKKVTAAPAVVSNKTSTQTTLTFASSASEKPIQKTAATSVEGVSSMTARLLDRVASQSKAKSAQAAQVLDLTSDDAVVETMQEVTTAKEVASSDNKGGRVKRAVKPKMTSYVEHSSEEEEEEEDDDIFDSEDEDEEEGDESDFEEEIKKVASKPKPSTAKAPKKNVKQKNVTANDSAKPPPPVTGVKRPPVQTSVPSLAGESRGVSPVSSPLERKKPRIKAVTETQAVKTNNSVFDFEGSSPSSNGSQPEVAKPLKKSKTATSANSKASRAAIGSGQVAKATQSNPKQKAKRVLSDDDELEDSPVETDSKPSGRVKKTGSVAVAPKSAPLAKKPASKVSKKASEESDEDEVLYVEPQQTHGEVKAMRQRKPVRYVESDDDEEDDDDDFEE